MTPRLVAQGFCRDELNLVFDESVPTSDAAQRVAHFSQTSSRSKARGNYESRSLLSLFWQQARTTAAALLGGARVTPARFRFTPVLRPPLCPADFTIHHHETPAQ